LPIASTDRWRAWLATGLPQGLSIAFVLGRQPAGLGLQHGVLRGGGEFSAAGLASCTGRPLRATAFAPRLLTTSPAARTRIEMVRADGRRQYIGNSRVSVPVLPDIVVVIL
jgi:hypothetical protein